MMINEIIVICGSIGIILIMGTFLIIMNALTSKKKPASEKQIAVSYHAGEDIDSGDLVYIGEDDKLYRVRYYASRK